MIILRMPAPSMQMSSVPAISVVLPCWNAAGTLARAIESIRRQTFEDWEMVVVDDGSTDQSREVARAAAKQDGRIRLLELPHRGIVQALRAGCEAARGQVIARMDADDISEPRRFAMQVELLESDSRIGLVGTQVWEMGSCGAELGRRDYLEWLNSLSTHDEITRNIFIECPIAHPTFVMRKEALEDVGGYQDNGWAEDYDLIHRLNLAGYRFGNVPEMLLGWSEAPGRLSRTDPRYSRASFRACKRHYLRAGLLDGGRRFVQWGAGAAGKEWLREWGERQPEAVIDINPRKIGEVIHGVRVIAPDDLPPRGEAVIVVTVPIAEARAEIRAWLNARSYVELRDYVLAL